jgi:hypothetical protein
MAPISHPTILVLPHALVLSIFYLLQLTHSLDNVSLPALKAIISTARPVRTVLLAALFVLVLHSVHSTPVIPTIKVYGLNT